MEVVFLGPVFYSHKDEDLFFKAIYDLPQYSEIQGKGRELFLTLNEPLEKETIVGLLVTFKRWEISAESIQHLKPVLPNHILWSHFK